jgi:8-oxo-dGTP pyrophosphatase MutT (NUDIX family)
MDQRESLLKLLKEYRGNDETEEKSRLAIIDFVEKNERCFDNDFKLGHITGSALVVDRNFEHTLLTHHSSINKWFQFGGHSDSSPDTIAVGLREAQEESGLKSLEFIPGHEGIFDVDIHPIPERGDMPIHNHYDIRIILTADKNEPYTVTNESHDLRWVKLVEIEKYNSQPAFVRLAKKAIALKK